MATSRRPSGQPSSASTTNTSSATSLGIRGTSCAPGRRPELFTNRRDASAHNFTLGKDHDMVSLEIRPQADVLEELFKRFPDVPREIVLKVELLSLGHWFTDAALEATAGSLVKSYRLFSYDLIPMDQLERNEARLVPEWFFIFQGQYDLRPVIVQTVLDPNSPYVVDVVD